MFLQTEFLDRDLSDYDRAYEAADRRDRHEIDRKKRVAVVNNDEYDASGEGAAYSQVLKDTDQDPAVREIFGQDARVGQSLP